MSLYALSDLHLSIFRNKPMDKFGEIWKNHTQKIKENWQKIVNKNDTVIIAGDISWAMNIEEVIPDFEFIKGLNGRKIILEGNHDYWFCSISKLRDIFDYVTFIKNDFTTYENYAICGSRGWLCPNTNFTDKDEKIYKREIIRINLSIDSAIKAGYKDNIILVMHFPPLNDKKEYSEFINIIKKYNIKNVIYGHIHNKENFKNALNGYYEGVNYYLTSSDFLNFCPTKIL